jgi:hypothetical protein
MSAGTPAQQLVGRGGRGYSISTVPPGTPTGTPSSDVYARALAWLQRKGLSLAEAEATLAVFSPSEEGVGETEAIFLSTRARPRRV